MIDFIQEFQRLLERQPRISALGYQNQNSPYTDSVYTSKNAYMCFQCDRLEDSYYCFRSDFMRNSTDCTESANSQWCYECVEVFDNCYGCTYSHYLRSCTDCDFSYDLVGCSDCFGCVGLRRAQYHIFNQPYSREEYKVKVLELKKDGCEANLERLMELRRKYPHVYARQYRTENVFGDLIQDSQNCYLCFDARGCQDAGYIYKLYNVYGEKSYLAYDVEFSVDLRNCYETIQVGDAENVNFGAFSEHVFDSEFIYSCFNSKYLFGCVGVNRKEFLLLNRQLDKETWHKQTTEIRDQLRRGGSYGWEVFGEVAERASA